jgi:hypothetical protein
MCKIAMSAFVIFNEIAGFSIISQIINKDATLNLV